MEAVATEKPIEKPPLRVRNYDPARDRAFVVASWVRSYEQSALASQLGAAYLARWTAVVEKLIGRIDIRTICATSPQDDDLILGFACASFRAPVLHYVFVKKVVRRMGVARMLVGQLLGGASPADVVATHRTIDVEQIARVRPGLPRYDFTRIWLP